MESLNDKKKTNTDLDLNTTSYEFCNHLLKGGEKIYNSFIVRYSKDTTVKNFFKIKSLINFNQFSQHTAKNYFDEFFVRNINLDWAAVYNPLELQMDSTNREGCIFTVAFDQEGNTMAASNHNHNIEIWDMNTKKIKKIINDHKEIVTGLEYLHRDYTRMMSCSLDKTIKLWKDNKNVHTFLDHSDWVRCISLRGDDKYFLSGCVSSVVKLWDLERNKVVQSITNRNPDPDLLNTVNSLHFMNSNENVFLCGLRNGVVKIFDIRAGQGTDTLTTSESSRSERSLIKEFKAHKTKLNSVKFNKEDKYLLSSGRDSTARLWDIRQLNVRRIINLYILI